MSDDDDEIVAGTIVGIDLARFPPMAGFPQLGPLLNATSYRVKLENGAEVRVDPRLPRLKHSWMCCEVRTEMKVKVALGTVLEPVRIVGFDEDA
jgi:hypothetical protein